jgi:hypothetical protein
VNLKTEGEFIHRLYREGRINLADVYGMFYKGPKDANPKTMRTILMGYYHDGRNGQLRVVERDSDTAVSLNDDTVTQNPSDYDVVFNHLQDSELGMLGMQSGRLMVEDEDDEGESEVYVTRPESITVYGKPKGCQKQAERLCQFLNYVGILIVTRDYETLSSLFWDPGAEAHTPAGLEAMVAGHERKDGRFEVFQRPQVLTLYWGEGRDGRFMEEMKLPKGSKRHHRAGLGELSLASSYTPNGVPNVELTVYADVLEDDQGRFRIGRWEWLYTD